MPRNNGLRSSDGPEKISRRSLLKGAAALAATSSSLAFAPPEVSAASGPSLAYVGTYTSPEGPELGRGKGEGIYLFEMNRSTGALTQRKVVTHDVNPTWVALDPSKSHLYVACEAGNFRGAHSGSVTAYSIEPASGDLTLLNTVSSEGGGPCHVSVHPSGKYALVANFGGATVAVLPIRPSGELGSASDVKHDVGKVRRIDPTSAPAGKLAAFNHTSGAHAHMIQADPTGRFIFAVDLGLDQIYIWRLDLEKGTLSPNDPPVALLPPGDGPRHFAIHKNGRWLYSLQEQGSTVVWFELDPQSGKLTEKQSLSTLPAGYNGTNYPSEIVVSPDGRFVYAANRLHDSIAIYSIGDRGTMKFMDAVWTRGDYPRHLNINPSGDFLYSCNQRSDVITAFRINHQTGMLNFTGLCTSVGTPACIVFLS
jgi:6-phosphogluconolactonase (cycloisomerase 2 family)